MTDARLLALPTPCLLVAEAHIKRNIDRQSKHAKALGVSLRPHLKMTKCIEAAENFLKVL